MKAKLSTLIAQLAVLWTGAAGCNSDLESGGEGNRSYSTSAYSENGTQDENVQKIPVQMESADAKGEDHSEEAVPPQSVTGVLLREIHCQKLSPEVAHCWLIDESGGLIPDHQVASFSQSSLQPELSFTRLVTIKLQDPFMLIIEGKSDAPLLEALFNQDLDLEVTFVDGKSTRIEATPISKPSPLSSNEVRSFVTTPLGMETSSSAPASCGTYAYEWFQISSKRVTGLIHDSQFSVEILHTELKSGNHTVKMFFVSPDGSCYGLSEYDQSGLSSIDGVWFDNDAQLPLFTEQRYASGVRSFRPEKDFSRVTSESGNGVWKLIFATHVNPSAMGNPEMEWRLQFIP